MNVYYQLSTDEIFTFNYEKPVGEAVGLSSRLRYGTFILFKTQIKEFLKLGLVVKIGKL